MLALWFALRFPRLGPKSVPVALLNVAVAYFGGLLALGPLVGFWHSLSLPGAIAFTVVGGALPPLVYLFLTIAWLLRSIQGLLLPRA